MKNERIMNCLSVKMKKLFMPLLAVVLLLPACNTKSKTERMQAVVDEVCTKYKSYEDISQDDQIFEAYDFFVKQKDYENAAPAALYSGCVRQAKKEYESAMNYYKEADKYGRMVGDSVSAAFAQYYIGDLLNASGNAAATKPKPSPTTKPRQNCGATVSHARPNASTPWP